MIQAKVTKRCISLSFLVLGIVAMFASTGVYAPQPGPCRQLKHTIADVHLKTLTYIYFLQIIEIMITKSKNKGIMIHRSMYLDVFGEQEANKPPTPVNLCLAIAWPPKNRNVILGTDHKQYVVIYICHYLKATKSHVELINTYTAEKKPSQETLVGISEAFTKNRVNETLQLMLCDY